MANRALFAGYKGGRVPETDTVNLEFAPAYALEPRHALAQYAATGCLNRTYYASAREQLRKVLALCAVLEPRYVAQVAIHARERGYMKDMPALLCAWLSTRDLKLHDAVFARVIDNARMLRTYVQILRSGVVGRKSLGSAPKRLVREWLAARSEDALFSAGTGQNPSMADILRMVRPKPADERRASFYGYMLGRETPAEALPPLAAQYERFRAGESLEVPDLPLMHLTALPLSKAEWRAMAFNAPWQTLRMNLNAFARQGVFEDAQAPARIAAKLRDREAIGRARVFPYQLLSAWSNLDAGVPAEVREALQDAMELAVANVPAVEGAVVVCPDVSGSMSSPVTGVRHGASSAVRCVDVAALVAAAVLRKNPRATVLPFETDVVAVDLNPRDSIFTNAQKLAAVCGGGTNCSAPLRRLNRQAGAADLVIFVSDNQSWVDARAAGGSEMMRQWAQFRSRNRQARLVCLDIQPFDNTQAAEQADVLNIGGFSDHVFELIAAFSAGELDAGHWADRIARTVL